MALIDDGLADTPVRWEEPFCLAHVQVERQEGEADEGPTRIQQGGSSSPVPSREIQAWSLFSHFQVGKSPIPSHAMGGQTKRKPLNS